MAAPGQFARSVFPFDFVVTSAANAGGFPTTVTMATLNNGYFARFMATDTRDIASVYIKWSAVTAAGTVQVRIETIDATTGKPSGSLYDASAAVSVTPTLGWQICTFASLPTAGLVAGTEYAVVVLTTVGGTTQTIAAYYTTSTLPGVVGSASDGTTRSNFAELGSGSAWPILSFVMEDSVEESLGCCPYGTSDITKNLFGTVGSGSKITVPTGMTFSVVGIDIGSITRVGTPAGDLRLRIFSGNSAVTGTTVTVDKDSLANVNNKRIRVPFAAVSLASGTYRIIADSASSANSSNCWRINTATARTASLVPSSSVATSTSDVTAGTITWADVTTDVSPVALVLDDITVPAAPSAFVISNRKLIR